MREALSALEDATESASHASVRIHTPGLQPPRTLLPTTLDARNQTMGPVHPRPQKLGNEGPGENNRGTSVEPSPPCHYYKHNEMTDDTAHEKGG